MHNTLLFILVSSLFTALSAQIIDQSFPLGFDDQLYAFETVGRGDWVAAIRTGTHPAGPYNDSIFVLRFNQSGDLKWKHLVNAPQPEALYVNDLLSLEDGGVVLLYTETACDISSSPNNMVKIDSNGVQVWQKNIDPITFKEIVPNKLVLAPDGNLLGFHYSGVEKISTATGTVFSSAKLVGNNNDARLINLMPGTEDFIAANSEGFKLWKKGGDNYVCYGSIEANWVKKMEIISPTTALFLSGKDSKFYFLNIGSNLTITPLKDFDRQVR